MNAFVEMRRFLTNNALMFERINEVEVKQMIFQKNTEEGRCLMDMKELVFPKMIKCLK